MNDIVPELYDKILADFEKAVKANSAITAFLRKMENKKATSEDVSEYAGELGHCASTALLKTLTVETVPDGILYWNIVERTVKPLLEEVHRRVNEAASEVTRKEDKKLGINIKPQWGEFPEERVKALLDQLAGLDLNEVAE